MQYTEQELNQLIQTVEKEFSEHLAKTEVLAKSEDSSAIPLVKAEDEKEENKEEASKEAAPEHKEEKPESKEESKEEGHEEKHEEKQEAPEHKEESKEAAPEHKEESANPDAHDYDDEDLDHMHQMYTSMSKGELRAHHDTIKKCMDSHKSASAEQPMEKSEKETTIEVPVIVNTKETELLKSEVEAHKAKAISLQKSLDTVSEILTKLVKKSAPQGKAITSVEALAKSEAPKAEEKTLSKQEITEILTKKASDPTLKKSDRDAINDFYLGNNTKIERISHLLK